MTYEEKLAELEKLKAEIAGKPQFLTSWDGSFQSYSERCEDDFEPVEAPRVEVPLVIDEAEARRLFPKSNVQVIEPGTCVGRKGLPDDFVQLMYRSYCRGKSIAQVAKIYKRSRQSVHDTFQRRGLKLRPDSKALAKIEFNYRGQNYAPGKSGYLRSTGKDRRQLQHVIWEEFHGPVPPGHQVIFLDGNKRNFDLQNLACMTSAEVLARVRTGENATTKERRLALARGDWTPKPPSKYDLAFLTWFKRHGWLIHEAHGTFTVWTHADAICKFRVTALMIERLAHAGHLVSFHPPNDPFTTHWGLPENRSPKSSILNLQPSIQ
jgi:hypothetical protein